MVDVALRVLFFFFFSTNGTQVTTNVPDRLKLPLCLINESHCFIGQSIFIYMYVTSDSEVLVQLPFQYVYRLTMLKLFIFAN